MRYAFILDGVIQNLIVADPEWLSQQHDCDSYIPIDDLKGSKGIGSQLADDGFFYEPQPHPDWIRNGDGRWRPPLTKPNPWQHQTISGHFGKTADQIHVFKNVVSDEMAAAIVEFADSLDQWTEEIGTNANRLLPYQVEGNIRLNDPKQLSLPVYDAISSIIDDVAELVETTFNVKVHRPLPTVMRMGEGSGQAEHYDKMADFYIYSDAPIRDYDLTAVVYYNSDFIGGELRFPQHDLTIKPETGMVVIYPGDRFHTHEVLQITRGVRYTSPLFFSIEELL